MGTLVSLLLVLALAACVIGFVGFLYVLAKGFEH